MTSALEFKAGFVGWVIPPETLDALIVRINTASVSERARWWCAMNVWRWPFPEMVLPAQRVMLPRNQFDRIFNALGRGGGFAAAGDLWSDRIARDVDVGGPGVRQHPEVRYPW